MSSSVHKYRIRYDGNDGMIYEEFLYCKHEHVCDCQKWCDEDGSSVNFDCVTDNHAFVKACCIAGINIEDKYFFWEEIKSFTLPKTVARVFGYKPKVELVIKK